MGVILRLPDGSLISICLLAEMSAVLDGSSWTSGVVGTGKNGDDWSVSFAFSSLASSFCFPFISSIACNSSGFSIIWLLPVKLCFQFRCKDFPYILSYNAFWNCFGTSNYLNQARISLPFRLQIKVSQFPGVQILCTPLYRPRSKPKGVIRCCSMKCRGRCHWKGPLWLPEGALVMSAIRLRNDLSNRWHSNSTVGFSDYLLSFSLRCWNWNATKQTKLLFIPISNKIKWLFGNYVETLRVYLNTYNTSNCFPMSDKVVVGFPAVAFDNLCRRTAAVHGMGGNEILPVRRPRKAQHVRRGGTVHKTVADDLLLRPIGSSPYPQRPVVRLTCHILPYWIPSNTLIIEDTNDL